MRTRCVPADTHHGMLLPPDIASCRDGSALPSARATPDQLTTRCVLNITRVSFKALLFYSFGFENMAAGSEPVVIFRADGYNSALAEPPAKAWCSKE
jgi:hypothetical protein